LPRKAANVRMLLSRLDSARNCFPVKRVFHATTTSHSSPHVARGELKRKSESGLRPRLSILACTLSWSQAEVERSEGVSLAERAPAIVCSGLDLSSPIPSTRATYSVPSVPISSSSVLVAPRYVATSKTASFTPSVHAGNQSPKKALGAWPLETT